MDALADNFFNLKILAQYWPSILGGFLLTVEVALLTIAAGVLSGLGLAVVRAMRVRAADSAIAITKGTALGTAVALPELLGRAQSAMAIAANPSPLTLAAALYLLFFVPLVIASRFLERGAGRAH